jgi:hypothetical protein
MKSGFLAGVAIAVHDYHAGQGKQLWKFIGTQFTIFNIKPEMPEVNEVG